VLFPIVEQFRQKCAVALCKLMLLNNNFLNGELLITNHQFEHEACIKKGGKSGRSISSSESLNKII